MLCKLILQPAILESQSIDQTSPRCCGKHFIHSVTSLESYIGKSQSRETRSLPESPKPRKKLQSMPAQWQPLPPTPCFAFAMSILFSCSMPAAPLCSSLPGISSSFTTPSPYPSPSHPRLASLFPDNNLVARVNPAELPFPVLSALEVDAVDEDAGAAFG